jgi:hypothetical protein
MKDDGRFVDSDMWKQLAERVDSVALPAQHEAATRLTAGDLRDLLDRAGANSDLLLLSRYRSQAC